MGSTPATWWSSTGRQSSGRHAVGAIKRVIPGPRQTVQASGNVVIVDGVTLAEPYLGHHLQT